ncbi:tryptophan--tRNA ligase [Anabaena sp. FACHB-709]|uniref:Tryptophan--tRNA ligase n=3 Tax=Nostocaceae TaxID=1162 RepID=SYW_NOSS1|nr:MULTISPECIES: tryptophan--tRNA ligase [Nostocaceae]Q8YXE4.1 RecName: Full=Tryptophan--tRNA ligase; AltName: Full=Tryptophanyl-tRNA synthetase; Short=TrpRS [Nostoc sp. PCC 7120 = FACHB-418]BAY72244.1 tryptophanyl-tRNA synthetase [Trichormus variabilis NIES-23]HBW29170.1 tryptophan--tRNA ligase [Nostoc sp. UBA8866]MBD2170637.1 tryptophan--tRNA ligase [Anabaena cylindrica FACHB-318]MBD2262424.1 tryptophan--tRNA ligase [Anabaena sp. FACHB-709]MBD2271971.1 tryptophan--tRNA ligase [Nostoc sp. PC
MGKQRVLSGVQPTGNLHLGNYLGAIRNWVEIQDQYDNFFCVVDLHAITVPHNPATLAADTYAIAALYLACGIDLKYSNIFVQSHVSAHSELAWFLNCITPLNWLQDMIQFKEKAVKQGENVGAGLLIYPVLMAADILLYQADKVPVGEDQKQHLELTRDIVNRFNHQFAKDKPVMKLPEPLIRKEGARVMSLTDGTRKMSKSDPSELSRINLLDPPDQIANKIKRCKTDPVKGLTFDDPERPECNNLLTLYMLLSGKKKEEVAAECQDMGWGQFKPLFTETAINALKPIQEKYQEITADKGYLESVLRDGREKAETVANQTLADVKAALGYSAPV